MLLDKQREMAAPVTGEIADTDWSDCDEDSMLIFATECNSYLILATE